MTPVHLGIGVLCAGLVIVPIGAAMLYEPPETQYLAVVNDFENADCRMDLYDGSQRRFSVAKDGRYETKFKSPKAGFLRITCQTRLRKLESPNSLHLVSGSLTTVTFKPDGEADVTRTYGGRN